MGFVDICKKKLLSEIFRTGSLQNRLNLRKFWLLGRFLKIHINRNNSRMECPIELIFWYVTPLGYKKIFGEGFLIFCVFADFWPILTSLTSKWPKIGHFRRISREKIKKSKNPSPNIFLYPRGVTYPKISSIGHSVLEFLRFSRFWENGPRSQNVLKFP